MAICLLAAAAQAGGAGDPRVDRVSVDRAYVSGGEAGRGTVHATLPDDLPADVRLVVTMAREIDVPTAGGKGGRGVEKLLDRPVGTARGAVEWTVPWRADDMLVGSCQLKAELVRPGAVRPVAAAWGPPVTIGVRRRIDLAGEWRVGDVKVFEGEMPQRRKDWQMPPVPEAIALPGELPFDEGFRGWVTLSREVAWARQGELRPRLVFVDGASDSALVRVNGRLVGETDPVDDYASLTGWLEFHCKYKGPENVQKRYLLMAGGCEYPSRFALPEALGEEGTAKVEIVLRGTSGGILGLRKRPYGVLNGLHLELAPAVYVRSVSFDATKPGPQRRFTFRLDVANETGREFRGRLRCVCGRYEGRLPYSGPCPAYAAGENELRVPAGGGTVEFVRDEVPRFDTCRATFLVLDEGGRLLDAASCDFHTVTIEVRDRRDLYLNNERFLVKFQGSWGEDRNGRMQLKIKGGNGFRAHKLAPSPLVPGFWTAAANINDRYADGLLTSAGGALLASCEKCTFWDPKDPSNVHKAVRWFVRRLGPCPGIIQWEATNELHGEPEAARVEILKAFHAYDPYHRPVLATKSSGEWEAEARDGRVAGVDIVGCQYLLSKEATESIVAAVTEQPIMSTEVNWNDGNLTGRDNLFNLWLDKGLCGSLLFDYSGGSLTQGTPLVPPPDTERDGSLIRLSNRRLYQDLIATARQAEGGRVKLTIGNRMPYVLRNVVLHVAEVGRFDAGELAPGDALDILLPAAHSPPPREAVSLRASFTTHGGLTHLEVLTPPVEPAPAPKGGVK